MKLQYLGFVLATLFLICCSLGLCVYQTNEEHNRETYMSEQDSPPIEESITESDMIDVEEDTMEESTTTFEETSDDSTSCPTDSESSTTPPENLCPPEDNQNDGFIYYEYYYDPRTQKYEQIALSKEWQEYTYQMCVKYEVPYEIVLALMGTETGWDVNIGVSDNKLYYGIGMVHIEYNEEYLKKYDINLCTPRGGIEAVCFIISQKLNIFNDIDKAMIAYNHGNGGAQKLFSQGIYSTAYTRRVHEIANGMLRWCAGSQMEESIL